MVYLTNIDEFISQAEKLYAAEPLKSRFVLKVRRATAEVVAKVTDDKTCLKYRTQQQSDLKKLDQLQATLLASMTGTSSSK